MEKINKLTCEGSYFKLSPCTMGAYLPLAISEVNDINE